MYILLCIYICIYMYIYIYIYEKKKMKQVYRAEVDANASNSDYGDNEQGTHIKSQESQSSRSRGGNRGS